MIVARRVKTDFEKRLGFGEDSCFRFFLPVFFGLNIMGI